MIKEIRYGGYSAAPSDYDCADGDLECADGIVPDNGGLAAMPQPGVLKNLGAGWRVMYVHRTADYTHWMLYNGAQLRWMNPGDEPGEKRLIENVEGLRGISALGNTLVGLATGGMRYFIWKDGGYVALGDHIPHIELSFGLTGNPKFYSTAEGMATAEERDKYNGRFKIAWAEDDGDNNNEDFTGRYTLQMTESGKRKATETVMARVNRMLAEVAVNKGRFALPFLVRYALRLYDGTLTGHSAPVLMNPATKHGPLVIAHDKHPSDVPNHSDFGECDVMMMSCALDYMAVDGGDGDLQKLLPGGGWDGVVKSVDVFVSAPIYHYDQSGSVERIESFGASYDNTYIGRIDPYNALSVITTITVLPAPFNEEIRSEDNRREDVMVGPVKVRDGTGGGWLSVNREHSAGLSLLGSRHMEWRYDDLFRMYYDNGAARGTHVTPAFGWHIPLPRRTDGDGGEACTANFYKLCSISAEELEAGVRKVIEVPEGLLQSLVTRERMTDDYLSHDRLEAKFAHTYNARINLAGMRRELFRGFKAEAMLAYCGSGRAALGGATASNQADTGILEVTLPAEQTAAVTVDTWVKDGAETRKVTSEGVTPLRALAGAGNWGRYLFYPNANAVRMALRQGGAAVTAELNPHDMLNGAAAVTGYGEPLGTLNSSVQLPAVAPGNVVEMHSKVYTSEVNNPFVFPLGGINTIGTGEVLGIAPVTKALSQGQFGQFPLYAFCTDGVWAMELDGKGLYKAVHPVTRDVCADPASITQTDNEVLFATTKCIMAVSGSGSTCISDSIDGLAGRSFTMPSSGGAAGVTMEIAPLREYLPGCGMAYDYANRRIVLYNPERPYSYVYSIKERKWGMYGGTFASTVNAYPDTYAMDADGRLLNVGSAPAAAATQGTFWTRPIKLDAPGTLKTIDTVVQRGVFREGHVQQALYGSRNLRDWELVGSSAGSYMGGLRGTPYKYFKMLVVCSLERGESLSGCTVSYTERLTGRLR